MPLIYQRANCKSLTTYFIDQLAKKASGTHCWWKCKNNSWRGFTNYWQYCVCICSSSQHSHFSKFTPNAQCQKYETMVPWQQSIELHSRILTVVSFVIAERKGKDNSMGLVEKTMPHTYNGPCPLRNREPLCVLVGNKCYNIKQQQQQQNPCKVVYKYATICAKWGEMKVDLKHF